MTQIADFFIHILIYYYKNKIEMKNHVQNISLEYFSVNNDFISKYIRERRN